MSTKVDCQCHSLNVGSRCERRPYLSSQLPQPNLITLELCQLQGKSAMMFSLCQKSQKSESFKICEYLHLTKHQFHKNYHKISQIPTISESPLIFDKKLMHRVFQWKLVIVIETMLIYITMDVDDDTSAVCWLIVILQ